MADVLRCLVCWGVMIRNPLLEPHEPQAFCSEACRVAWRREESDDEALD